MTAATRRSPARRARRAARARFVGFFAVLLAALFGAETVVAGGEARAPSLSEAFRLPTYLESDRTFVARERSARPEAPPLLFARHLLLRVKTSAAPDRRSWPTRDLLLVRLASGERVVTELYSGPSAGLSAGAPRLLTRVAISRSGADDAVAEFWTYPDPDDSAERRREDACAGTRYVLYAGRRSTWYFPADFRARTVAAAVADVRDAAIPADALAPLSLLRRLDPGIAEDESNVFGSRLLYTLLFPDLPPPADAERTLVLTPDPEPPGDLAPWRRLTYLPPDLPLYVPEPEAP